VSTAADAIPPRRRAGRRGRHRRGAAGHHRRRCPEAGGPA